MKINIVFSIVALFRFTTIPVHAQGAEPPLPSPPAGGSYILDELDWLTGDQVTNINSIIRGLERDGVAEIAVVTLNDCGADKLAFRKSIFDMWGSWPCR